MELQRWSDAFSLIGDVLAALLSPSAVWSVGPTVAVLLLTKLFYDRRQQVFDDREAVA